MTVTLGAIAFASMLCEGATADWSAVYLRGPVHVDPAIAGLGYAGFALVMAAVRLTGASVLARLPAHRLLPTLAALAAIAMTIALATGTALVALLGFAVLGAGVALVVPSVFSAAGQLPGLAPGVAIATVSACGWAGLRPTRKRSRRLPRSRSGCVTRAKASCSSSTMRSTPMR